MVSDDRVHIPMRSRRNGLPTALSTWLLSGMFQCEPTGDARVLRETQARRPKPGDVGRATPRAGLSEPAAAAAPRRAPGDAGAAGQNPGTARSYSLRSGGRRLRGVARGPGNRGGRLRPVPVLRVPTRPASRGYLRNSAHTSPTTFKSVFLVVTVHTEKLAPHPQGARGFGARRQAPPSAAVAAACGLLSLSHGQVTQRGAAAATAAAPEDSAPRRFATGPPGPRPPR
ncbi:PREDICTED: uncharacterized protein LOC101362323 [Odobenus rosmarus divergens]|uniref:Uncharacterized protein LOC101362323 n=1 Tax=Odobenus rosmarus divergens TaxID=9708 RepID=A0A9B0GJF7_ODORO